MKPAGLSDVIAGFLMAEVTANDGLAAYILVVVAHAMPTNCPVSFIMLNNDFESKLLLGTIGQ